MSSFPNLATNYVNFKTTSFIKLLYINIKKIQLSD